MIEKLTQPGKDEGSFPKGKGKMILGRRHRHSRTLSYQRQEGDASYHAFIKRVIFKEVSGHQDLIKSGPGNRGLSACVTIHVAMSFQLLSLW